MKTEQVRHFSYLLDHFFSFVSSGSQGSRATRFAIIAQINRAFGVSDIELASASAHVSPRERICLLCFKVSNVRPIVPRHFGACTLHACTHSRQRRCPIAHVESVILDTLHGSIIRSDELGNDRGRHQRQIGKKKQCFKVVGANRASSV